MFRSTKVSLNIQQLYSCISIGTLVEQNILHHFNSIICSFHCETEEINDGPCKPCVPFEWLCDDIDDCSDFSTEYSKKDETSFACSLKPSAMKSIKEIHTIGKSSSQNIYKYKFF